MSDAPERLSWAVGPADSRAIRVLFYLAEGLLGGAVAAVVVSGSEEALPAGLPGGPVSPGLVAVFVLLVLGSVVWFYALARVAVEQSRKPDSSDPTSWAQFQHSALAAWTRDQQWRWPGLIGIVVAAGLVALGPNAPGTLSEDPLWFGALLLAVGCSALGELLSSEGRIDPESLTLATPRYREWREVDLRTLTSVRRVSVGEFTVCWLSVAPGVGKRTALQGFYAVPTAVLERAWSAFEEGLAADPPVDAETAERARFFRRVNRVVAGGVLSLAVGTLFALGLLGVPVWNLLVLTWLILGGGLFFLKLAA